MGCVDIRKDGLMEVNNNVLHEFWQVKELRKYNYLLLQRKSGSMKTRCTNNKKSLTLVPQL